MPAQVFTQNWSAFAPGFEELHENREYVEREDEFDLNSDVEIAGACMNAHVVEHSVLDYIGTFAPSSPPSANPTSPLAQLPTHLPFLQM
jgi:hypothetical protein